MGLFSKRHDDSEERILHRDLKAEISRLEELVQTHGMEVQEAESRLRAVHTEYEQVLSSLMSTKKEINNCKDEKEQLERINKGIRIQIDEGRRILKGNHKAMDLARRAAVDLEKINSEIKARSTRYSLLDSEINQAQKCLDSINAQIDKMNRRCTDMAQDVQLETQHAEEMSDYTSRLAAAEAERDRLQSSLDLHVDMVNTLKRRLAAADARLREPSPQQADRSVVEAASALVASFRKRLAESQKELAETKMRLAQLEKAISE